jgi:hypothetical protein
MENAQELLLEEIRDFLVMVAHKAGDMILAAHPSTGKMDLKKNCKLETLLFAFCIERKSLETCALRFISKNGPKYV